MISPAPPPKCNSTPRPDLLSTALTRVPKRSSMPWSLNNILECIADIFIFAMGQCRVVIDHRRGSRIVAWPARVPSQRNQLQNEEMVPNVIEFKGFDLSQRLRRHEPWNIRQCGMASRSDDDAGASNYSRPSSAVAARPMAAALARSAGSPSARSPGSTGFVASPVAMNATTASITPSSRWGAR